MSRLGCDTSRATGQRGESVHSGTIFCYHFNIIFLPPAHEHLAATSQEMTTGGKKKKGERLTNGGANSAVTPCLNIELKMEQYQSPHVRAINIHRPPTGGKSWRRPAPRRNLLFRTKCQKCVAAAATAAFQLASGVRKKQ